MKKILVIYPGFSHYRDGIIEELKTSSSNSYVFAGDRNGYNNIKPYTFSGSDNFVHFPFVRKGHLAFNKGLLAFVLKNKFDGAIVHCAPYWLSIFFATIILRLKGIRVYNWTHGILQDHKTLRIKFYYYFHKIFFNGLLVYGKNARTNLINLGFKEEKIKVIYNSLNYKKQLKLRESLLDLERTKIRSELFKNQDNYQLIFIGRLTPQKKLSQLIEALHLLRKEGYEVNLLFVGDGSEKNNLLAQTKRYNLEENICFYGACFDEDINYKLIASSDCCVAPGEIGLTAVHSLMFGTPVISHSDGNNQMPEYEAIIPGVNGELFERDNVTDLKDQIIKVLTKGRNTSREAIRKQCYSIVDTYYNPDYQKEIIESLF